MKTKTNLNYILPICLVATLGGLLFANDITATLHATEFHVATNGADANPGTKKAPFRSIQRAADAAQPGDVVTVHAGVYRERVSPPRGGTSDAKRITYQAPAGEKVTLTGSELVKGWEKVSGDTWKVTLPNSFFGKFNPFAERIHGDWCSNPRGYHAGAVYLNGDWLTETTSFDNVLKPAGKTPLWFARVDGVAEKEPEYLMNIASFRVASASVQAEKASTKNGTQLAPCSEGGQCVGFIRNGNWLSYDGVDFGNGTDSVEIRAAAATGTGGDIELHLDSADGELLGVCAVPVTGDWQKWQTFTAKIKPVSGVKNLCLVFKPHSTPAATVRDGTEIFAQFPGVNPNEANVEINVRQTVFTPEKTGINYITVRGFDLRNAAPPWAPPTAAQIGIISAYWCKGWIIEGNRIGYSPCCGVALGKYGDEWDNRAESAEGYVGTLTRALTNGWNKATVGGHIVRDNEISHCEQTGIVGSLGCSFSTVTGNDIHDIHIRNLYGGAEMAGIKFHGPIDVVISGNHIYRCGSVAGIWLDWMAQGAQVTGNLLHDNSSQDMFLEMQHGPILVANNLFLSRHRAFALNSQGIAFVHNLIAGSLRSDRGDTRATPFHKAHTTALAGMHTASAQNDSGDCRFYNNLCAAPCNLSAMNSSALPCFAAGNVFTKGAQPSKYDTDALLVPDFDAGVKLEEKSDGWYLTLAEGKSWRDDVQRRIVTTELLGKAKVPDCAYDNPDGSALRINTDYFGNPRAAANPFPGPFEKAAGGKQEIKVWPIGSRGGSVR